MTDQELLYMLRNNVGVSVAACRAAKEAADRIEALTAKLTECEARLSKAVEALRNRMHCHDCSCGECEHIRDVLAELEKTDA